jgi:hypothetical protein
MSRLVFNPSDPFPLLDVDQYSQAELAAHARDADLHFGYKTSEVEACVLQASNQDQKGLNQTWIDKGADVFQTPYLEIRAIAEEDSLKKVQNVVDLGAGYGRWPLVLRRHRLDIGFLGYELVRERVDEAKRVWSLNGVKNAQIFESDLCQVELSAQAEAAYFIFDFGFPEHIELVLQKLRFLAKQNKIIVVARGGLSRQVIESSHPWLSQVVPPLHHRRYSIYSSAKA